MKILVLGGAGYIGSHVVKDLLNNNLDVVVYDDLSTGCKENLFSQAEFIHGNILDYTALLSAMKKNIDAVILLAGKKAVGESMENPAKYAQNNLCGNINVLNAMQEANVNKIVFSSSAAVYGAPQYLPLDEQHPINPMSFYGFTKAEMEKYLQWYDSLKGIKYVSLRYFNAVGYDEDGDIKGLEKNPQNLLPIVMETLNGTRASMSVYGTDYDTRDGSCIRDYIHVTDLADAHTKAIHYLNKNNKSQLVNLGTQTGISVLEMLKKTEELTGKKIPYTIAPRRSGDPAIVTASAKKAKEILGWQASHSNLDNIILSTWEIYQQ